METNKKTEEEQKDIIFDIYTKCQKETDSDRSQVFIGQLWDLIFKYNRKLKKDDMGREIFMVVRRLVKKNYTQKTDFLKILNTSIKNAENEYYRNHKTSLLGLTRKDVKILKDMGRIMRMGDENAGRILTEVEHIQRISKWMNIEENEVKKYLDIENRKPVGYFDKEGNNLLNSQKAFTPYIENTSLTPENEFFRKRIKSKEADNLCNIIETIIKEKRFNIDPENKRKCYRALITNYFLDDKMAIETLYSVLDKDIIEYYREKKEKPNDKDIFQKYLNNPNQDSASSQASELLADFKSRLRALNKTQ